MPFVREYKNKAANFMPPFLSEEDDVIPPETHIGITDFIKQMNDKDIVMSVEKAKELRRKSFYNVLELFQKYGSSEYDKFWNIHIEEIAKLKLNEFAKIPALAPFCDYVECFSQIHTSKMGNKYRKIGFGISKKALKKYFEKYEQCQKDGTEFIPPRVQRKGKYMNRDLVVFGAYDVKMAGHEKVQIERNEIYRRFDDWCNLQGITKREGILMALQAIVDNNPIEKLRPLEAYSISTELDDAYLAKAKRQSENKKGMFFNINTDIYNKMCDIVKHYNADPQNKAKGGLTLQAYTNNAIREMNGRVSMKYSAPEQWAQMQKIKKGEIVDD